MKTVYFDYAATTPVDPQVLKAMLPYFTEEFGNSMSLAHSYGRAAAAAVESARKQTADLLNCSSHELTFTSGATESNNWIIQSLVQTLCRQNANDRLHILTSPVEHNSIVKSLEHVAQWPQVDVELVPVTSSGQVDPDEVEKRLRPTTRLMSFMWVNNELGTLNPIKTLADIAHRGQVIFHCDATQAVGKIPVDLSSTPIDFLSFSAHKFHGPKGIGVLFSRAQKNNTPLAPLIHGGGHERGFRSGTLNVPAIVGLGEACHLARQSLLSDLERHWTLRQQLISNLKKICPQLQVNGHISQVAPHILNVTFNGHQLPSQFNNLAVSQGSACHSGHMSSSHVLKAIGLSPEQMAATLRLSFGRGTTAQDVEQATEILKQDLCPLPARHPVL